MKNYMDIKLEHKSGKLATVPQFLIRMARYGVFALLLIVFSVAMGTLGYHFIARLNWLDSFYMACMILNGVGPVAEIGNNSGKVFSALFALYSGVAFLSMTAMFLTPIMHRLLHILHIDAADKETIAEVSKNSRI